MIAISRKRLRPIEILVLPMLFEVVGCTGPNPGYRRGAALDAAPSDAAAGDRDPPPADVSPPADVAPEETRPPADALPPVDAAVETGPDGPLPCQPGCPGCANGVCVRDPALALYWAFDDASGTTALDSSGNEFHGTYQGASGVPEASPVVPPWRLAGQLSRVFVLEGAHAVRAPSLPVHLKVPNNVSISVWYRATRMDMDGTFLGSELVSVGDNLVLRLRRDFIEFAKQTGAQGSDFVQCPGTVPTTRLLDGNWHHVVGVAAPSGMTVYFDGDMVGTNNVGTPIMYTAGQNMSVGRHAERITTRFDGHLDEVRIYTRALTAADIQWLSARAP